MALHGDDDFPYLGEAIDTGLLLKVFRDLQNEQGLSHSTKVQSIQRYSDQFDESRRKQTRLERM